ncbi:MAG: methyl-accepting chemotaxis protein [Lachnospiraceae bacterium]|nr:methyl-accepting chemotaxis protein [Lachnospiraceae bacterium]
MKKNESKRIGFFKSISFQITLIYVVLLALFVLFSFFTMDAMGGIKDQAVESLDSSSETLITLGSMKANVSTAVSDVAGLARICTQADTEDSIKKRNAANYRIEIESLHNRLAKQEAYLRENSLWEMFTPGKTAVQDATDKLEVYFQDVFTILDMVEAGKYDDAFTLMDGQYQEDLQAAQTSIKVMEDDVVVVVDRVGPAIEDKLVKISHSALIMTVFVALLIVLSLFFMRLSITNKIRSITKEISSIVSEIDEGRGDMSRRLVTMTQNELSLIVGGFNSFMDTLQQIIDKVKDGTEVLEESSSNVSGRISEVSENIMNTSAAMEELSATMDSVANVTQDLNHRMEDVNKAADDIRNGAVEGLETVHKIKESASAIKADTVARKDGAKGRVEDLSKTLEQSVRDAEKVSQINDLTTNIMDIAKRTNLLSLNASIEAARAGEAGKGFAVVASEIGDLAANSHQTAENIQSISTEVTAAVNALSEDATRVIEFINDTILNDYDTFGNIGDDYMNTSDTISEMVQDFTDRADVLSKTMNAMLEGINSISQSIDESSEAIMLSAESSQEIVNEISEIDSAVQTNTQVSDDLTTSVAMFQ